MPDAVYAIEHPDHVFSLHYFPVEDEKGRIAEMQRLGVLWIERVGIRDSECSMASEGIFAMHCSRQLIPLRNQDNDGIYYLALDLAEQLLATADSAYTWMSQESRSQVFLRFGRASAELVHPRYCHFHGVQPITAEVPLYIQETMIHPICELSVDPHDLAWAECDWRECLGSVEANVVRNIALEVRMDDASVLVADCSRPMLMVSQCLPPTYIPREWLEKAVSTVRRRIQ